MTTTEGNKLIAEFMGWEKSPYPNTPDKLYRDDDKNEKQLSIHVSQLLYHSSWDWLMPVVQKIGEIDSEWLADNRNEFIEPLMCASIFTSIKSVWDYVVLFIQWYNENKTL